MERDLSGGRDWYPRLLVGIPLHGSIAAKTKRCLDDLLDYCFDNPFSIPGIKQEKQEVQVREFESSLISRNRHAIVKHALDNNFDYILWLDSDMTFPPDTAHRLIAPNQPIVACNCTTRHIPAQPTARVRSTHPQGKVLFTERDSTGLVEVWRIGMAIMLTQTEVFREVPPPHFNIEWEENTETYIGEDWYFCGRVQQYGYRILVNQALSWEIGHIGEFVHTHEVVGDVYFAQG